LLILFRKRVDFRRDRVCERPLCPHKYVQGHTGLMRTTIEMKPEHRARVIELAARRGDKGFSTVIAEALAGC
jgi:hypothetical protein